MNPKTLGKYISITEDYYNQSRSVKKTKESYAPSVCEKCSFSTCKNNSYLCLESAITGKSVSNRMSTQTAEVHRLLMCGIAKIMEDEDGLWHVILPDCYVKNRRKNQHSIKPNFVNKLKEIPKNIWLQEV